MTKDNTTLSGSLDVKAGDIQFIVVAVDARKSLQEALNDWVKKNPEAVIVSFTFSGTVYVNSFVIAVRK